MWKCFLKMCPITITKLYTPSCDTRASMGKWLKYILSKNEIQEVLFANNVLTFKITRILSNVSSKLKIVPPQFCTTLVRIVPWILTYNAQRNEPLPPRFFLKKPRIHIPSYLPIDPKMTQPVAEKSRGTCTRYFMQKYPVTRTEVVSILVMEVQWSNLIRIRYSG